MAARFQIIAVSETDFRLPGFPKAPTTASAVCKVPKYSAGATDDADPSSFFWVFEAKAPHGEGFRRRLANDTRALLGEEVPIEYMSEEQAEGTHLPRLPNPPGALAAAAAAAADGGGDDDDDDGNEDEVEDEEEDNDDEYEDETSKKSKTAKAKRTDDPEWKPKCRGPQTKGPRKHSKARYQSGKSGVLYHEKDNAWIAKWTERGRYRYKSFCINSLGFADALFADDDDEDVDEDQDGDEESEEPAENEDPEESGYFGGSKYIEAHEVEVLHALSTRATEPEEPITTTVAPASTTNGSASPLNGSSLSASEYEGLRGLLGDNKNLTSIYRDHKYTGVVDSILDGQSSEGYFELGEDDMWHFSLAGHFDGPTKIRPPLWVENYGTAYLGVDTRQVNIQLTVRWETSTCSGLSFTVGEKGHEGYGTDIDYSCLRGDSADVRRSQFSIHRKRVPEDYKGVRSDLGDAYLGGALAFTADEVEVLYLLEEDPLPALDSSGGTSMKGWSLWGGVMMAMLICQWVAM
ncbi:unnamed protein product [Vitrella brassicaformis CCMP3155]|uniref:Uncharacterized protein n=1 Tax=Vitrella brassicaformis (strain CCMP3155) TaxID=1169540 RepID=A0A0G4EHI6_VITBC|nr:unnamed protein product [Vitrella brassicaformis CCMP3155]|eukprot:CEL95645.1 unnamed protein product [Vitrella brassicaformis CCMP3155]